MNPIQQLRDAGQSIRLDKITSDLLNTGTLGDYLYRFSLTGFTSNPSTFDYAINDSTVSDEDIQRKCKAAKNGERLFFELTHADVTRAANRSSRSDSHGCGVGGPQGCAGSAGVIHMLGSSDSVRRRVPGGELRPRGFAVPLVTFAPSPGTLRSLRRRRGAGTTL
jgi:Transaldolase/Fructose-6-phosphate aldolase